MTGPAPGSAGDQAALPYAGAVIDLVARKTPPPGLRPALRSALGAAMRHFGVEDREVTVVLVGDRTIRALKREHWGEDAPTDVLSFPTWEPGDPFMPPHLGDIIISLGFEEGATGEEWQVFHDAWAAARAALSPEA